MTQERNHGPQPLGLLLEQHTLTPRDLVEASDDQLTFKAVSRAVKGRWLTPPMQEKVRRALCAATGKSFTLEELFTYAGGGSEE